MITPRGGDDAPDLGHGAQQSIQVEQSAAHLECTGGRMVLVLDPDGASGARAQLRPRILRGWRHGAVNELGRLLDFVQADGLWENFARRQTMAKIAKTADRKKVMDTSKSTDCPKCGKPTRIVKRVKDRERGVPGGVFISCSACEFFEKL